MGKKKNKHGHYDEMPPVDFSNPDEVRKYFSDLVGDDDEVVGEDNTSDGVTYVARKRDYYDDVPSRETATFRGINALAADDNKTSEHSKKMPPVGPPIKMDVVYSHQVEDPVRPTARTTEKPANSTESVFRVSLANHPYGDQGKGLAIGYCPVSGMLSPLSIVVPLYEDSNPGIGHYFEDLATEETCASEELHRIFGDIALLMILRGIPTAVYPNDPQGISNISEVVRADDMDRILLVSNGGQIQVYFVDIKAVDAFVEKVCSILENDLPFAAHQYKLIFDLINMIASTVCQDIPYIEDTCEPMNEKFEDMLDDIHDRVGNSVITEVIDITGALRDGLATVDTILNDIYATIGDGCGNFDPDNGDDNEDDEDYEDEDFNPYTEDGDDDEVGGASNDNTPFPSMSPTENSVEPIYTPAADEQVGNPDAEDASVASYSVYSDDEGDGGQRGSDNNQCTTNIGAILKSQGIVGVDNGSPSGDSGTGGRTPTQIREEAKEEELGRGSSGAQQQTEAKAPEKEEPKAQKEVANDSLTIKIKTVGRV